MTNIDDDFIVVPLKPISREKMSQIIVSSDSDETVIIDDDDDKQLQKPVQKRVVHRRKMKILIQ